MNQTTLILESNELYIKELNEALAEYLEALENWSEAFISFAKELG